MGAHIYLSKNQVLDVVAQYCDEAESTKEMQHIVLLSLKKLREWDGAEIRELWARIEKFARKEKESLNE